MIAASVFVKSGSPFVFVLWLSIVFFFGKVGTQCHFHDTLRDTWHRCESIFVLPAVSWGCVQSVQSGDILTYSVRFQMFQWSLPQHNRSTYTCIAFVPNKPRQEWWSGKGAGSGPKGLWNVPFFLGFSSQRGPVVRRTVHCFSQWRCVVTDGLACG